MTKKNVYLIFSLFVITLGFAFFLLYPVRKSPTTVSIDTYSPKNATYTIDGQSVTLVDGVSSVPAATGSASMITTRYFGNEVVHDFDGDGRQDVAFIVTQETGGSGTFYYVVAALNKPDGYVGSDAVFLGDRIALQATTISTDPATPNVIVVNYADRKQAESFAVAPSVGKSVSILLDTKTMKLGEVAANFEGEANPSTMTLGMKKWNWVHTLYGNSTTVTPKTPRFTLTFKSDKTFSATTDCNSVGGEYSLNGNEISFSHMISTMMYCDGSQEQNFVTMLNQVQTYMFTSKGELVLNLKLDSGSVIFN